MSGRKALAGVLLVVGLLAAGTGSASATESPVGCNADVVRANFVSGVTTIHRNGDVIDIVTGYRNNEANACDAVNATITLQTPNPDGTAGPVTTLAQGLNVPAGTPETSLPAVHFTPNFDADVFRGPITVSVSYTLRYPGGDLQQASGSGTYQYVNKPHVTLSVTPSVTSLDVPGEVTYTYHAVNDSTFYDTGDPMTSDVAANVGDAAITDDKCAPVTYVSGDTILSDPTYLNKGEDWTFTCTTTLSKVGAVTDHAVFTGLSSRDGRAWPTTTAQSTVNTTGVDLNVGLTHPNNFTRGSENWSYIVAGNIGNVASSGPVTVALTLAPGLSLYPGDFALAGDGWACTATTLICSRTDSVAAGTNYPPITVVAVPGNDTPDTNTNTAAVSGGGDADLSNNTASDAVAVGDQPQHGPGPPIPPVIRGLKVAPKKFRVPSKSAKVKFSLSKPASVVLKAELKVKKKGRKAKWKPVAGSNKVAGVSGANKVKFSGRLKGSKLKPGSYRLSATATDADGLHSPKVKPTEFAILRHR